MTNARILFCDEIDNGSKLAKLIGSKTRNLAVLKKLGYRVPEFFAVPGAALKEAFPDDESLDLKSFRQTKLFDEIIASLKLLPGKDSRCVVRSSALLEDQQNSAMAGQFKTVIDLGRDEVPAALLKVVKQARKKLDGDLSAFSVIIQEYIKADHAGVIFTREPNGGRELVVEYHEGKCEDIVSGQIVPERLSLFWPEVPSGFLASGIRQAKKLEQFFSWPQDIEWAISNGEWYFLQTRPISTISPIQFLLIQYLDKVLSKKKFFYWAKNEVSEVVPRPTTLDLELLGLIFAELGPIDWTYRKYKINYHGKKLFHVLGNELFIDMEAELKTLLPIFTYDTPDLKPKMNFKFNRLLQLGRSLLNAGMVSFTGISNKRIKKIAIELEQKLALQQDFSSIKELVDTFLKDYHLIFEINFLAKKALKDLEQFLKTNSQNGKNGKSISVLEILDLDLDTSEQTGNVDFQRYYQLIMFLQPIGNSLALTDTTAFSSHMLDRKLLPINKNIKLKNWLEKLPEFKGKFFLDLAGKAGTLNQLREGSRFLTVKWVNQIRNFLAKIAENNQIKDTTLLNFMTIVELENLSCQTSTAGKIVTLAIQRQKEYYQCLDWTMPPVLCNRAEALTANQTGKPYGVSRGRVSGILIDLPGLKEQIIKDANASKYILYTENLTPELVKYFPNISGIISFHGGMLSHLAIMAREGKVPVIVNANLKKLNIKMGNLVKLDGLTGSIIPANAV